MIIAAPRSMSSAIGSVVSACGEAGVPFNLLADVFGEYLPPPQVTRFGSLAALRFAPVHHSPTRIALKRGIDLLGATIGLAAAAPVIALAAIAIKLTSPGPTLFRQTRCGLYGRRFTLYKLRTMVNEAEALKEALAHRNEMSGPVFKMRDDPRITPLGRWLRRFSIDELPQLWNVLVGDMSLVGPRPEVVDKVEQFDADARRTLALRPGITDWASLSFRNI